MVLWMVILMKWIYHSWYDSHWHLWPPEHQHVNSFSSQVGWWVWQPVDEYQVPTSIDLWSNGSSEDWHHRRGCVELEQHTFSHISLILLIPQESCWRSLSLSLHWTCSMEIVDKHYSAGAVHDRNIADSHVVVSVPCKYVYTKSSVARYCVQLFLVCTLSDIWAIEDAAMWSEWKQ